MLVMHYIEFCNMEDYEDEKVYHAIEMRVIRIMKSNGKSHRRGTHVAQMNTRYCTATICDFSLAIKRAISCFEYADDFVANMDLV